LDKTTFPSSNDVKGTTVIVIVNVIFFALYLFLIDRAWVYVLEFLTWVINTIAGA
jgi:preprotein translocase SecE subunit